MLWVILFAFVVAFMLWTMKATSKYTGTKVTVYGSMSCPWTVKQIDYLKTQNREYDFVDCAGGSCPDFVGGFPTSMVDGQVKVGYTEY